MTMTHGQVLSSKRRRKRKLDRELAPTYAILFPSESHKLKSESSSLFNFPSSPSVFGGIKPEGIIKTLGSSNLNLPLTNLVHTTSSTSKKDLDRYLLCKKLGSNRKRAKHSNKPSIA
jgi:hypothetical protein